jgi:hypothetical protein
VEVMNAVSYVVLEGEQRAFRRFSRSVVRVPILDMVREP